MATEVRRDWFPALACFASQPAAMGWPNTPAGAMKRFLDRLPRFAAGLGHVDCKYDDCRERKRIRGEVRAG